MPLSAIFPFHNDTMVPERPFPANDRDRPLATGTMMRSMLNTVTWTNAQ
jgi:hypothetical protein